VINDAITYNTAETLLITKQVIGEGHFDGTYPNSSFHSFSSILIFILSTGHIADETMKKQANKLKQLIFNDIGLEAIPESIGHFGLLTTLMLPNNNISAVPQSLANCAQLTRLDLR